MAYSPAKHLARRLAAIQDGIVPIPVEDGSVTNAKLAPVIVQSIKANPTDGLVSPGDLAIGTNSLVGRGTGDLRSLALGAGLSITSGVLNGEAVPETAAELLAKIITVDGIGSSLDADLLDGQHAAAFATAAQGALAGTASQPGHTHAQGDVTGLVVALAGKQDALISGTTIKTVNDESLLGAGNVVIAGGGSGGASPIISWAI